MSGLIVEITALSPRANIATTEIQAWKIRYPEMGKLFESFEQDLSEDFQQSQDLCSALRSLASLHMQVWQPYPGAHTMGPHGTPCGPVDRAWLGQVPREDFDSVLNLLSYRVGTIRQAVKYTRQLELDFVPPRDFHEGSWCLQYPDLANMRTFALLEIVKHGSALFPENPPLVFAIFPIPLEYLASALAATKKDELFITTSLERLVKGT